MVIVGGGLAGIAAALRLADCGRAVTLLEGRPRLGGAAFSFRRGELNVDNGQHLVLRCCDHYQALLGRIGVADQITMQDRLSIPVLRADGRSSRIARTPGLPVPLHLAPALARYRMLSLADRLRATRGVWALRRLDPDDPALDRQTLEGYLREHGQSAATIAALWGLIATATMNIDPAQASLALATMVFRTALFEDAGAADIGFAALPLGELHHGAAGRALREAGVEVRLATRARAVRTGAVALRDGRELVAGQVILAVPHREAFALLPELAGTRPAAAGLGASAIVNVHVVYDRPVTDLPFAAAVDSPAQWIFDRTQSSGLARVNPGGQYLAVTASAADAIVDTPAREVTAKFLGELARLFPTAARARVLDAFVTRERRATFRQAAGNAMSRPPTDSGIPGVWLAGAWTATGWPDTMESAVRSGLVAADSVLAESAGVARQRHPAVPAAPVVPVVPVVSGRTPIFAAGVSPSAVDSGMVEP
ncbi:MAG: hydroxysqualene dehydroxylase HpnE [Actinomycetia bacterium]|nr:hydroxysqualene dehydroxylase HpnE [Actinomycetes bacterium]